VARVRARVKVRVRQDNDATQHSTMQHNTTHYVIVGVVRVRVRIRVIARV
jgi:hypothetical protein